MENAIQTDPLKGVFVFATGINQTSAVDFMIMIINWCRDNPNRKVKIVLNSQGGNILDALYMYDQINMLRAAGHHVTVVVHGRSASCAGWLLQAGDVRVMGAHAWLLIHEVSSEMKGTISQMRAELRRCEQLQAQISAILCSRTGNVEHGLTLEKINTNIAGGVDWWLTAEQALAEGLIDEIEPIAPFATQPASASVASAA